MQLDTLFTVPQMVAFLLVVFALWGSFLSWKWWQTVSQAELIYMTKRELGELRADVSLEDFRKGYIQAESPRAQSYFLASALASAILIPPLMTVFSRLWYEIWSLTGRFEPAANGTLIHTFALFVFSMLVMITILYFAMKRYHTVRQPRLRDVMRELNGETP